MKLEILVVLVDMERDVMKSGSLGVTINILTVTCSSEVA